MSPQVARRLFTVDEYDQMVAAGILHEDDRVELIEGEILQMAAVGSRHAACVDRLTQLFVLQLAGQAIVRIQNPIHLNNRSEPEPDLTLLTPRTDFYTTGHPGPGDILLVIEVADTSVGFDRSTKIPLYGRAGIRETWLVDLTQEHLEVYRQPVSTRRGYRHRQLHTRGMRLSLLAFPDLSLLAEDILA
jgi:Uma2 family endonuclease